MAITYEWKVSQLDSYPTLGDHINVIFNVHWSVRAVDGEYEASVYGAQQIVYDEARAYVPYEELTEPMIIDWLKATLSVDDRVTGIEEALAQNIENQRNPPVVTLPLPWSDN